VAAHGRVEVAQQALEMPGARLVVLIFEGLLARLQDRAVKPHGSQNPCEFFGVDVAAFAGVQCTKQDGQRSVVVQPQVGLLQLCLVQVVSFAGQVSTHLLMLCHLVPKLLFYDNLLLPEQFSTLDVDLFVLVVLVLSLGRSSCRKLFRPPSHLPLEFSLLTIPLRGSLCVHSSKFSLGTRSPHPHLVRSLLLIPLRGGPLMHHHTVNQGATLHFGVG
jgi:hypothetical protein